MSIQKTAPQNQPRRPSLRMTAMAAALMTMAGGFATVSMAQAPAGTAMHSAYKDGGNCNNPEQMEKMREQRMANRHKKLDIMANRLQITANQQPVWNEYKKAWMNMSVKHFKRPAPDMNAAQLAQFRAQRAEQMAKKLAVLSKATTDLRAALGPNQQQVLDEMSREHRHKRDQHKMHGDAPRPMQGPMGNGHPMNNLGQGPK